MSGWLNLIPEASGGGGVDTVNGSSGDVVLDAADVGAQPSDADLTVLAGLVATTDNFIQSKSSAWASRTPVQVAADLALPIAAQPRTVNAQTGTTYTLVLSDAGKIVTLNNAGGIVLTVPTNASAAFPVGTLIDLARLGVGQPTITPAGGVTVNSASGLKIDDQYGVASLLKTATDTWLAFGRLEV